MIFPLRHVVRFVLSTFVLVALTACGGGGDTPMYAIGGTVSGLGAGQSVVLKNNGGDPLTVSGNVAFTFNTKVSSGEGYAVTVSPSTGKACTVMAGSGTASHDVSSVAVVCVPTVSIGVSVSGLVGQGLTLQLITRGNPGVTATVFQDLAVTGNGHFVFPTPVNSGHDNIGYSYLFHVKDQPTGPLQSCVPSDRTISPVGTTVPDVDIVCGDFREFAYVAHTADNTISAFSVDGTTGTIASPGPPVTTGLSPTAIAAASDWAHLYVVNGVSNDVSAFAIDSVSGGLTPVPGSPFASGLTPEALSPFGNYLYVANSGSDDVSAYAVDQSSGALSPLSPATYASGAGPSAIAIHPQGGFLYTANTGGSNDISAFLIDASTGGLTAIAGSPFGSGSNVSSLVLFTLYDVSGGFLYAANASGSAATIHGFSVDPASGALTSLTGFPVELPLCNHIAADPTGAYLYATAGTNVFGFAIDAQSGALSPLNGFPVDVGANADSLAIDPTGRLLYVRNGGAGTMTGFQLDAVTGALTPMLGSPFAVGTSSDYFVTF